MEKHKIMIVGTGNVGASTAFAILNQRTPINELILTDVVKEDAAGEAMDLSDALAVAPSFLKIRAGDYSEAKDCDVVVITAGAAQKPGETRLDLIQKNTAILKTIVKPIMQSGFHGIFLVVSNPVDVLTYLTWKLSGLPAEKVIGSGTVLDSARLRERLSEYLHIHPKSIHAYQVGEHGDTETTLYSLANVGGQKIAGLLNSRVLSDISDYVKNEAYAIIERKGATYYGIALCVAQILNCILNDENRVLSVSSLDPYSEVYFGWPTLLGREGVVRRLDLTISEREGLELQKSINILKETIASTGV